MAVQAHSSFGVSCATLGDIDNDRVLDVAVGANSDDAGGDQQGAVVLMFMETSGRVKRSVTLRGSDVGGQVSSSLLPHSTRKATSASLFFLCLP